MKKLSFLSLLFAAAALVQSCGTTTISAPVTWPNKVNLKEFKCIYVGDYGNSPGNKELHEHLINYLRDTCKLNIIDSAKYQEAINRKYKDSVRLIGDIPGKSTRKENEESFDDSLSSIAVISTNVIYYKYEDKENLRGVLGRAYSYSRYIGEARINAYFNITNFSTGKTIFYRNFLAKGFDAQRSYQHEKVEFQPEELYFLAREGAIQQLVKYTMPFTDTLDFYFITDSDLPTLEEGVELISKGLWQEGIKKFLIAA